MNNRILVAVISILFACNSYGQTLSTGTKTAKRLILWLFIIILMGIRFGVKNRWNGYDEAGNTILEAYYVWDSELNDWIWIK